MKRDPWKLVTSVEELRPGLCVELRPCISSGKCERLVLLKKYDEPGMCIACLLPTGNQFDWHAAGWSNGELHPVLCAESSISERRLYALIDDDTAADETTVTRRRERVE